jgi:membrane fusion protein, heavy metal efflux system
MKTGHRTLELTPARIAVLVAALLGLPAAAAGVTLLVERRTHEHGEAADHEGHRHGEAEDTGHAHGQADHDDHAHAQEGEHGHGEHRDDKLTLSPAMIQNAGLEILTAGPGTVAVTVTLPGEVALNAEAVAHVTPRVAGTAREVKKQLGDTVKKGDLLAVLDSRELAELQRELLAAKERLTLAESSFKRQEALWNEKISAEKDHLAAKQALAEAQIEHRSAAQKLHAAAGAAASAKGGGYALIAPIDGTIIQKHIGIGEVMKDDTQAFVIADLSSVWVNVTVYARDLVRVRVGQTARVRAEGIEKAAEGTLVYLGPVVGEQNRSAVARVVLENPGTAWRPGLFATAEVTVTEAEAPVVISEEAVQQVQGRDVVFVEEGGAFDARAVKLGRRGVDADAHDALLVEVQEGVAAGERYVGKNSFILKAELGKSEAGHEH